MYKPYSVFMSITCLVIGIFILQKPLLTISGIFLILASFIILVSCVSSKVLIFNFGQLCIYVSLCVFYLKISSVFSIGYFVLVAFSFYVFYKTMQVIINLEFQDEQR